MNITYIIGVVAAFGVMVIGMMQGGTDGFLTVSQFGNFVDGASVFQRIWNIDLPALLPMPSST